MKFRAEFMRLPIAFGGPLMRPQFIPGAVKLVPKTLFSPTPPDEIIVLPGGCLWIDVETFEEGQGI